MLWRISQKLKRLRKRAIHLWQTWRTPRRPSRSDHPAGLPRRQPGRPDEVAGTPEPDRPVADAASTAVGPVSSSEETSDGTGERSDPQANEKPPSGKEPGLESGRRPEKPPSPSSSDEANDEAGERSGPQANEMPPTAKGPRRISGKRRGKPRSPRTKPSKWNPKGRLQCQEVSESEWEIVLALPDGSATSEVLYDGTRLDTSADGCYPLPGLDRDLVVNPKSREKYRLVVEPPLIFKTAKDYKSPGRQVRKVTDGCFIVIAPDDWKWTGTPPPVEPAFTTMEGYRAHFVHCTADCDIGGFDNSKDLPRLAGSLLTGPAVDDDDDASGPLFVGPFPELRNGDDFEWAIVGEEGEPPGWLKRFKPSEQKLSEILIERERGSGPHRGWLFVRLYDETSSLVASSCFRYFPADLKIAVDDEPYTRNPRLPDADGHSQARLRFLTTPSRVCSGHDLDGDAVLVPDHRDDEVSVVLSTDTHSVRVLVSLPRIWWRLTGHEQRDIGANWQAKPLRLTRQRFEELALSGAILQLSAPHTSQIKCGFDDSERRDSERQAFRNTKAGTIDIPFDNFVDDAALEDGGRQQASLSVSSNDWPRSLSVVRIMMRSRADDADAAPDDADLDPRSPATPVIVIERNAKQVDSHDYLVRHDTQVVSWEVARRTGYISVPDPGKRPLPGTGSRIWVCIARGYVGVGKVVDREKGAQHHILQVRWLDTHPERKAVPFQGLTPPEDALMVPNSDSEGNQAGPWFRYTVGRLKMNFAWKTKRGHDA